MGGYHWVNENIQYRLVEKHVEVYKKILSMFPQIEKAIKKYDGKVRLSCLEKELEKIGSGFVVRKTDVGSLTITWYIDDKYILDESGRAYYINEREIVLVWLRSDEYKGKLDAQKMIDSLDETKEMLEEYVNLAMENWNKIDELKEKKERIEKQIEKFNKSIPYFFRTYLGLQIERG